jgi:hypothetical protein
MRRREFQSPPARKANVQPAQRGPSCHVRRPSEPARGQTSCGHDDGSTPRCPSIRPGNALDLAARDRLTPANSDSSVPNARSQVDPEDCAPGRPAWA